MSSSQQAFTSRLKVYAGKLTLAVGAIALSVLMWSNSFIISDMSANAQTIDTLPSILAISGVKDGVEGTANKAAGTLERNLGEMTGDKSQQAEGVLDQTKGDVKQGVGTVKNKLDNAKDDVENKSENIIDSVKDFFD